MCKKRLSQKARQAKKQLEEFATPKSMEELKAEEVIIADYQKQFSFEERLKDSQDCKKKHPDCVPLIIERASQFKDIKEMESCKFLYNAQSQTAQAMVRTQKDVQAKTMWFFVHMPNNKLKMIYPQSKLGVLYSRYRRSDGNLYIFYSDKNLVNETSLFMTIMQTICIILLIIYLYLYFFGIDGLLNYFGYDVRLLLNSTNTNSTEPIIDNINNDAGSDKIEL